MKSLILDCNYICHRIFHAMPDLSFHLNYTQIIYGFMKDIISLHEKFPSDTIVFAWDSRHSIRKKIYPMYKAQRVKIGKEASEEEKYRKKLAHLQFSEIKDDVLPSLGFSNVVSQRGFEADDIIAAVIRDNSSYQHVMVTTDKDLYQLIDDTVVFYNPATRLVIDKETFMEQFGCHPNLWASARAISGCSTDNITGVKGVGEKTAIRYLLGKISEKSAKYKLIKAAEDDCTIVINEELVKLPMAETNEVKIKMDTDLGINKYVSLCEKYNFRSLLTEKWISRWEKMIQNGVKG